MTRLRPRAPLAPLEPVRRPPSSLALAFPLALGLVAGAASASGLPDPRAEGVAPEERLGLLVERMRIVQEGIETLEAEFVQRKESALLIEPEEALGRFYFAAPDRVRWEYRTPNPISMVIDGERMTTWYRDLAQAERIDIGRQSQRVLEYLGAGSSLATLLEYFDVALHLPTDPREPLQLELSPRFERVARRLAGMNLWVDPDLYLPVRLHYVEADGDTTDYRFSAFRLDQGIPDERFELDLPESVDLRTIDLNRRGGL